jgi:acyl-CoA dehydrogenase
MEAARSSATELAPFFEERHRALAARMEGVVAELAALPAGAGHDARALVRLLGQRGVCAHLVPEALGGAAAGRPADPAFVSVRALVVVREALAEVSPLADALFAVQGLGGYPIALAGSDAQRGRWLPAMLAGERVGAFALTEPGAGSDVAALATTATREGDGWRIDGDKTLISNVPVADGYVVFANADPARGKKGITAFVVERGAVGLELVPQPMSSPHPLGELRLRGCRVSDDARLGAVGDGLRIALATLETFRVSVGAAACGMAAAALADALAHVRTRVQFGAPLAERELVQAALADMATELAAARLLVGRAAHVKDTTAGRAPAEVAMAKMFATEAAQRIVDRAVQLLGGRGVLTGTRVEALYRDVRPLRIYEGTSEIQKLIIARALLHRS